MKVTGWTDWYVSTYEEVPNDLFCEAKEAVIDEMRERGYKFSGVYHQNGEFGTPIIDGQYLFLCSQRTWGDIMAKAYPDEINDSDGRGYVVWAWNKPDGADMVVPGEVLNETLD